MQRAVVLDIGLGPDGDPLHVPRTTAPYQTLAPASSVTSPITDEVGATNAASSTFGSRPPMPMTSAFCVIALSSPQTSSTLRTVRHPVGRRSQALDLIRARRAQYGKRVPKRKNTFSSWRRGLTQRAVHAGWAWVQRTGSVTSENPGRFHFGSIGEATRLAFPLGTVFGEPWIHLGSHCIVGEQVTLTAGLMPDLDLGPEPILRIGDGVVLGRGSHVIADTTVTIGSDCYFGPYVYVTSTNHSYDDPHEPIGKQWPRMEPVEIGPGCWIGTGAVILPGARIGRNVVVAAGAVVRGVVPDHAVVAGAPARVVRRWTPDDGWQPPLRTPAPVPIPDGITPEQLQALAELDDETVAKLAELDEQAAAKQDGPSEKAAAEPDEPAAAELAELDAES